MSKTMNFRKLVTQILRKYGLSTEKFSRLSGIPSRTIQHLIHGDHKSFSLKNEKKFYQTLEKLESTSSRNHDKEGVIDFSNSKLPVCMKIGNLLITFKRGEV